ncbi:MAG TPA: PadR family transcriptional regulator [Gemmatimonadaceae bacterium]
MAMSNQSLLSPSDRSVYFALSTFDTTTDTTIMPTAQPNILQGTLDLLILKSLGLGELHGLGVARRVEQITRGTFDVGPGSLFPALHRLEAAGRLASRWGPSENNRRAKYYKLTAAGRRQLDVETGNWKRVVIAMSFALES